MKPKHRNTWKIALFIFLLGAASSLSAQDVLTISQIDTSRLLLGQAVDLYLSMTDARGLPVEDLEAGSFRVYESSDGETYRERPVIRFRSGINAVEGISFLLLVDNSGSMYETLSGRQTSMEKDMRISHAKSAIRRFLESITEPRDRLALVSFNTYYTPHSEFTSDKMNLGALLDDIQKPAREEGYTELYGSLTLATDRMSRIRGRKAIIVLSDGENYPYFGRTGNPSPEFQEKEYVYADPIELCQKEGISIFAINFGIEKDRNLQQIAGQTGGAVFDARDQDELSRIYQRIRERILREYQIRYRAGMEPAERRVVRVTVQSGGSAVQAERFYLAGTVFRKPLETLHWLLLIPALGALLLFLLLTRLRPPKKRKNPSLELLASEQGKASTRLFSIEGRKTVIGSSNAADFTIAGAPEVKEKHATVIFDEKKKAYTLVSDGTVTVNNKPVSTTRLESGDVINVGGTTLVFDDDVEKKK